MHHQDGGLLADPAAMRTLLYFALKKLDGRLEVGLGEAAEAAAIAEAANEQLRYEIMEDKVVVEIVK